MCWLMFWYDLSVNKRIHFNVKHTVQSLRFISNFLYLKVLDFNDFHNMASLVANFKLKLKNEKICKYRKKHSTQSSWALIIPNTGVLEYHQQYTFWMSPLSDRLISGLGVYYWTDELIQVCLIRETYGVDGTPVLGLGDTAQIFSQPASNWSKQEKSFEYY